MTKIWCQDYREDVYTDAAIAAPSRFIGLALESGKPISDRFPKGTAVIVRSTSRPADFFMAGPMLVISEKLKGILDRFNVRAEFCPIRIEHQESGAIDTQFHCLNVLEVRDCLDWERSRYTLERGYVLDIERLFLDLSSIREPPLYMIDKTIPAVLCASDDLAMAISQASCTGIEFKNPEEWRNPTNPV